MPRRESKTKEAGGNVSTLAELRRRIRRKRVGVEERQHQGDGKMFLLPQKGQRDLGEQKKGRSYQLVGHRGEKKGSEDR